MAKRKGIRMIRTTLIAATCDECLRDAEEMIEAKDAEIASLSTELAAERTQREDFGQALAEAERRLSADYARSEIASLRAKLDEEFQRGRQESWDQAQATIEGLRAELAGASAAARQDAEEKARLHEENGKLTADYNRVLAKLDLERDENEHRDDAEEKARLREALDGLIDGATAEFNEKGAGGFALARLSDARAALACTPAGVPNGVQQTEEIVRLRAPYRNADEEDWRRLDDWIGHGGYGQFWRAVFKEVRAALACRPQGERKAKVNRFECTQAYCECADMERDRFECQHFKECRPQGEKS